MSDETAVAPTPAPDRGEVSPCPLFVELDAARADEEMRAQLQKERVRLAGPNFLHFR